MALDPITWSPAWFNALETETEDTIDEVAALGYTIDALTYCKTWSDRCPIYATAARHAVYNFNRVKGNVQAAADIYDIDVYVLPQFTPSVGIPGEPITLAKLEALVLALAAVRARSAAIVEHMEDFGPWAGVTYAGGGPML